MKPKNKQEAANWEKARRQAEQSGIVLTRRRDKNGDYVCYMSAKARRKLLFEL